MEIIFATNNQHKLQEVSAILGKHYVVKSLKDIGETQDIPEDADTMEGNALIKAKYVFDKYQIPCFSDDSGLEVEALNNAPGVYSARYGGEHGNHERNMDKLLQELLPHQNRNARFRTVICYVDKHGKDHYFEGIIKGHITESKTGNGGFGYDPIFQPEGHEKTFAVMSAEEKNKISHRALALAEFLKFLQD